MRELGNDECCRNLAGVVARSLNRYRRRTWAAVVGVRYREIATDLETRIAKLNGWGRFCGNARVCLLEYGQDNRI